MIFRFETVPSTNDEALRLAAGGAPHGTAVVAEAQTAGRGRAGHSWVSPRGVSICASVVLRPAVAPEALPLVPIACGVGLARAVRETTGLPVMVKWPNDLLVRDRKVAGILCETGTGTPEAPSVVCGFGINVNAPLSALPARPVFPASSLAVEAGREFDRETVLRAALRDVVSAVSRLCADGGPAATLEAFRPFDALFGREIEINAESGPGSPSGKKVPLRGEAAGLAPTGALLLRATSGEMHEIWAGSVSFPA